MIATYVLIYLATISVSALKLPDELPRCNRKDAKLNECIKSAYGPWLVTLAKGLPEFRAPSIAPLRIESLSIAQGSGPVNLVQNYTDVRYHYYELTTVTNVEATITDTEFRVRQETFAKNITFLANYKFDGDVNISMDFIGDVIERDGERYVQIQTVKVGLNPATGTYKFENLFGGDDQKAEILHRVLNENAIEIFNDVRVGYEESVGQVVKKTINSIFAKVPFKDLFLD
ncbi:protein takeout-like isoform X2 [Photinus pyralis]|uniref:protein takeout-like isoform X2 n=1 Tax=Photinus pyralis TaxID=7054 RepID=UPI0012677596|nr:protein takeout-like isoform X2 [Photinus pyralis]